MLGIIITVIVAIMIILLLIRVVILFNDRVKFFLIGQENGFKLNEIMLFWKLAARTKLEEPSSLYFSVQALNYAIKNVINEAKRTGTLESKGVQDFLSRLYKYRTKVNLDRENKRGIDSTKFLEAGQKLRIILQGKGVFESEILSNERELIIKLPLRSKKNAAEGIQWQGQKVNVYLWRKKDASYVFDTNVVNQGTYDGYNALYLAHTTNLLRVQKRKSVRCPCSIQASLYFLSIGDIDFNTVENIPGYRCLIEDISESGALIRIGGKGSPDIQVKLQFQISDKLIIMYGVVRAVEYDAVKNQSKLHFECVHIADDMKNTVLAFVYNVLPQEEKDIIEAITETEKDKKAAEENESDEKVFEETSYEDFNENISESVNAEKTKSKEEVDEEADLVEKSIKSATGIDEESLKKENSELREQFLQFDRKERNERNDSSLDSTYGKTNKAPQSTGDTK